MTRAEALAEARRRWRFGAVRRQTSSAHRGYQVGEVRGLGWGRAFESMGSGTSWEAAFAEADRKRRIRDGLA